MLEQIAQLCLDFGYTFQVTSYKNCKSVRFRWSVKAESWSFASSGFRDLDICLSGLLLYLQRDYDVKVDSRLIGGEAYENLRT